MKISENLGDTIFPLIAVIVLFFAFGLGVGGCLNENYIERRARQLDYMRYDSTKDEFVYKDLEIKYLITGEKN